MATTLPPFATLFWAKALIEWPSVRKHGLTLPPCHPLPPCFLLFIFSAYISPFFITKEKRVAEGGRVAIGSHPPSLCRKAMAFSTGPKRQPIAHSRERR